MVKVSLYEDFYKCNLNIKKCSRKELKVVLYKLNEEQGGIAGNCILKQSNDEYEIYFNDLCEKDRSIDIDSAARVRFETELQKLDYDLKRFDETLKKKGIIAKSDKYCFIRQINFDDDSLIIDVYVKI